MKIAMANKYNKHAMTSKSKQSVKRKIIRGGWKEQWFYALQVSLSQFRNQPLATLLTVMVITISLTLPSVCYIVWKNTSQAALQWYPAPQITVYLSKTLDDTAAKDVVAKLKKEEGVEKINYLTREEAMNEFRNWSDFGSVLNMLEQNPLPAVAIITPSPAFQRNNTLHSLRDRIATTKGIDEVRLDDSWFERLTALAGLVGKVTTTVGVLMIISILLVIGNSVQLSISARRETINVQKLLGATDGFILRPFLYGGMMLGFSAALLSLLLSEALIWQLKSIVTHVTLIFGTTFDLEGISWDEGLLLLLIAAMIGWVAAWLATVQHLRRLIPQ